jgi:hypothetical protein
MSIYTNPLKQRFANYDGLPMIYTLERAWCHGCNGWFRIPESDIYEVIFHKHWKRTADHPDFENLPPLPAGAFA